MLLTPFVGDFWLFYFLSPFSDLSFLLDLRAVPLLLDSFLPSLLEGKGVRESFFGVRSCGVFIVELKSGDLAVREDLASFAV